MISRRDILIGGSCLAAAGGAAAMRPREQMSLAGDIDLEKAVPTSFAGWEKRDTNSLVVAESEDSLASRLYSQLVGRLYVRGGDHVMMLIAYGDTQSDMLQLHRPEVCYPAFGFNVVSSRTSPLAVGDSVAVPGRELTATSPQRTEHISYWTRIGEYLPTNGSEQRVMKLRSEISGTIPDGVLVRFSNAVADPAAAFVLNQAFAGDLMAAVPAPVRPALIGTAKARAFTNSLVA